MKRNTIIIFFTFVLLIISIGCSSENKEANNGGDSKNNVSTTISLAGYFPMDHLNTKLLMEFKENIEDKTDGELEIEVYPAGQLGDPTTIFGEVVDGTIDMASIALPTEHDPIYEAIYLPYLVNDYESAEEIYSPGSPLFDILSNKSNDLGLELLGFFGEGFIGVSSVKEIPNPLSTEESKETLIRVPGYDTFRVMAETFKYQTMSLDYSDIYTSLQTGIIDGSIGQSAGNVYHQYRDAVNFYYKYDIAFEATGFIANLEFFNSLSEEHREIIKDEINRLSKKSFELIREADLEYIEKLEEEGVEVIEFNEDELNDIAEFFRDNIWDNFTDLVGGEENLQSLRDFY